MRLFTFSLVLTSFLVPSVAHPQVPPTFLLKWGSTGIEEGQFRNPRGIGVDPTTGHVYVADFSSSRIQKFMPDSSFVTLWGAEGAGQPLSVFPVMDVTVDGSGNVIAVNGGGNDQIRIYDSEGTYLRMFGTTGTQDGAFNGIWGVDVDGSGNVFASDGGQDRIQKFDNNGFFVAKWGTTGTGQGQFNLPTKIGVDRTSGDVYVVDAQNDRIQKFDNNGNFIRMWGSTGTGEGQFNGPSDVTVDAIGNVYVADGSNSRVQVFDGNGTFLTQWGSWGTENGQFGIPSGVAVDGDGNIYVVDSLQNHVQKFGLATPVERTTWGNLKLRFP